jgi:hypothetical protein
VGFGDGQVADSVPYDEGILMASAAFTDARRSDDEMRLEVLLAVAASITDGGIDSLWFGTRRRCQRVRREVGSKGNQAEATLTCLIDGIDSVLAVGLRDSGEEFRRPGGAIGRGKKGEEERRLGAIYRHG